MDTRKKNLSNIIGQILSLAVAIVPVLSFIKDSDWRLWPQILENY